MRSSDKANARLMKRVALRKFSARWPEAGCPLLHEKVVREECFLGEAWRREGAT